MNRRDALKKLAAGGAIAMGGSMVLSSNSVAFAASGPVMPDPESLFTLSETGEQAVLSVTGLPPGAVSASYEWQINYISLAPKGKKQIDLLDENDTVIYSTQLGASVCGRPCTPWTPSSSGLSTVRLDRHKGMTPGDYYEVDVRVTWDMDQGPPMVATYRIYGRYGEPAWAEPM